MRSLEPNVILFFCVFYQTWCWFSSLIQMFSFVQSTCFCLLFTQENSSVNHDELTFSCYFLSLTERRERESIRKGKSWTISKAHVPDVIRLLYFLFYFSLSIVSLYHFSQSIVISLSSSLIAWKRNIHIVSIQLRDKSVVNSLWHRIQTEYTIDGIHDIFVLVFLYQELNRSLWI